MRTPFSIILSYQQIVEVEGEGFVDFAEGIRDDVGAGLSGDGIALTGCGAECGAAVESVVVVAAEEEVGSGATQQGVVAVVTEQRVVAESAFEFVVAESAAEGVITVAAGESVVAVLAHHGVVAEAADQFVVAVATEEAGVDRRRGGGDAALSWPRRFCIRGLERVVSFAAQEDDSTGEDIVETGDFE